MNTHGPEASPVTWYLQSRGRRPQQDYTWVRTAGHERDRLRDAWISEAKTFSSGGSPTILVRIQDGHVFLYADRLVGAGWPVDHQRRQISASLAAIGPISSTRQLLRAAQRLLEEPVSTALITFDDGIGRGFDVDGSLLTAWEVVEPGPSPIIDRASQMKSVLWGISRAQVVGAIGDLLRAGATFGDVRDPQDGGYLIVVSDLASNDMAADHLRPVLMSGRLTTGYKGAMPDPKGRGHHHVASQGRPWTASIAGLILLVAFLAAFLVLLVLTV